MHTAFIDASSAILLYKTDLFLDCVSAFSLIMAEEVFQEVTVKGYPGAKFFIKMKDQISIQAPSQDICRNITHLDRGEKETLALFQGQDIHACFIIMDDGKGAKYCYAQGIPFINALLVPKIFWYSGQMDKTTYIKKTQGLIELGRYSQTIINKATALSKKDLACFIPNEY